MSTGSARIPNFFIVGKPKAGTTALHRMLEQHPEIFMSAYKEPHHFHREYIATAEQRNRGHLTQPYREREAYLRLFEAAGAEKVIGESSTGYLYSKTSADEIAEFNPNAKILMVLREPFDFIHSYHSQLLRSANENEADFRKALLLEESRKRGERIPFTATDPSNLFYTEQAKYCEQVERYFRAFNRSQIKIVFYEDFKTDNRAVFREILQFLEVDPDFTPELDDINPTRRVRFPRLTSWLVYFADKRNPGLTARIPGWLLTPLRAMMRKIFYTRGERAQLDPQLKRELQLGFKPEVVKLSKLLDVDLVEKWGYDRI